MRPLWLWGFMASGKTTLGQKIAESSGAPFRDLDQEIAARAGMTIPELFRTRGEPGFRELEREVLLSQFGVPGVLALGGGALLSREIRLRALEEACVLTLEASPKTLLARAKGGARPLLDGSEFGLRELLESRARAYAETHGRIDTEKLDLEQASEAALQIWRRDPIAVAAGDRSYAVDVGHGIAESALTRALRPNTLVYAVTDENVNAHHGELLERLTPHVTILTPGEVHKTPASVERVWQDAIAAGCDRKSVLLGFGGGVVTDIAGFAAATFLRGIPWVSAPTTFLGVVDAAVGGKTGVDLGAAKNAVGAFWQPRASVCDLGVVATEPERGFRSALAEVVKSALIGDPALLSLLEESPERVLGRDPETVVEIARRSIQVKANIVSRDERESELRMFLNLGHTVGHALEAHTRFEKYSHGEAVSLGLCAALRLGEQLGETSSALRARVESLLARLGLPVALDAALVEPALHLLMYDKKRHGTHIRFVLVKDVGRVMLRDTEPAEIRRLLQ